MIYFSDEAALAYMDLTINAYDLELFDKTIYLERFYGLQNYYRGEKSEELIDQINLLVLEIEENEAGYIAYANKIGKSKNDNDGNESILIRKSENIVSTPHFKTSNKGKICNWIFTKNDHESFPSIPHGHSADHYHIKFDPFSGFIYNGKSKVQREDKEYIVSLWNDPYFRSFAKDTMTLYMQRYATFPWEKRRSFFGKLIFRQWFKFLKL